MCQQCPDHHQEMVRKHGVVVGAMAYSAAENALKYRTMMGDVTMVVTLPLSADMTDAVERATFLGEHLTEVFAVLSKSYTERESASQAQQLVADLEAMLRERQ